MNKQDIVEAVLKEAGLCTKKEAQKAVETVFDSITKTLKRGEEAGITGFGTFKAVKVAARIGRNPKTGQKIQIPASVRPKFKAGKGLKEAVR